MGIDHGESCCAREVFIGHAENTTVDKLTPHANDGMGSGEMHGSICKSVLAEIKVKFDINEGQDSERGVVSYQRVQWWQEDESKALNFGEYKDSLADDRVRLVRAGFLSSEDREDHMCDNPLAKVQQPVSHVVLEIARVASSDAQVMDGSYGRNRVLLLSLVGTSGGMDGVDQSHEVLLALKGDLIAGKTFLNCGSASPGWVILRFVKKHDGEQVGCACVCLGRAAVREAAGSKLATQSGKKDQLGGVRRADVRFDEDLQPKGTIMRFTSKFLFSLVRAFKEADEKHYRLGPRRGRPQCRKAGHEAELLSPTADGVQPEPVDGIPPGPKFGCLRGAKGHRQGRCSFEDVSIHLVSPPPLPAYIRQSVRVAVSAQGRARL